MLRTRSIDRVFIPSPVVVCFSLYLNIFTWPLNREIAGNNMLDARLHGTTFRCLPMRDTQSLRHHKKPQGFTSKPCLFLFMIHTPSHYMFFVLFLPNYSIDFIIILSSSLLAFFLGDTLP